MSKRAQFRKTASCVWTDAVHAVATSGKRSIFLLLLALSIAAAARAQQLPDAPSASVIAPLKRYSLNVSLDNKYSLKSSTYDLTPRLGISVRLGERETLTFSFSRALDLNSPHSQSDSVLVGMNFRIRSWGKIPRER